AIRKCLHQQQPDQPWQVAYLPIDPRDIGRDYQAVVRVNSQSGKGGVAYVLERDYGLVLPRWIQQELAAMVQQASETHQGEIDSATIHAMFRNQFVADTTPVRLDGYRLDRQNEVDIIEAEISDKNRPMTIRGMGEGAISAFIDAWTQAYGMSAKVIDYSEHAIGEGTDAEAVAYVQIEVDGRRITGAAFDHDSLSASLRSLISALNLAQHERRAA
ncbi:MAG: alpha-isopropylmalate synthase regulatory domain-containing protein, partial [Candidatus Thiodiazotropha sp.]